MKSPQMFVFLIAFLSVACTGDDSNGSDTNGNGTEIRYDLSDFSPPSGKVEVRGETPANKRIILARSDDGIHYQKDSVAFSDQANVPDFIEDDNGHLFLYYTGWTIGEYENRSAVAVS